jgi:hypothetical protein
MDRMNGMGFGTTKGTKAEQPMEDRGWRIRQILASRFQLPATKKHEEQPMKDGGCVMADG